MIGSNNGGRSDGEYLKVIVRDELGVEVELDQRSNGFAWLVSFYIVFKAEAGDRFSNAILLLDEPGLSLHALKQQEFRKTVSILAEDNQTIYSTHSPFMVGTDELDLVRVVEMKDRSIGTKVHSQITADDPRSLFPLQMALGYSLGQSLFAHQRNLVCEGLTDLWYLDAISEAFRSSGGTGLDSDIAIVPAGAASRVVYFTTLLHVQDLQVAALLDSDQEGESAATQDDFVRLLPKKRILRTKDFYSGVVSKPETEDLLRWTLVKVAKDALGWDVEGKASQQASRPICDIFEEDVNDFSKYRLARALFRWLASNSVEELTDDERNDWSQLISRVNTVLK